MEYEVTHERPQRGIGGLLGMEVEEITSASTPYTGSSRTAREYLVLDTSAWKSGRIRAAIRVTDEVTGRSTECSVTFDLVDEP